jgi:hypothetical protein
MSDLRKHHRDLRKFRRPLRNVLEYEMETSITEKIDNFFRRIYRNTRYPALIYCIGQMHSGKTTLALIFYYYFRKLYKSNFNLYYINALEDVVLNTSSDTEIENNKKKTLVDKAIVKFHETLNTIRNNDNYRLGFFIVLDDFGFIIDRSAKSREFLYALFRIRHITNKDKIVVWINGHYSKSLIPFFRATPYRVLTSITEMEIKQYSSDYLFPVSLLWDYYTYYLSNPDRYIALVNWRTISEIVDITLDRDLMKKIKRIAKEHNIEL